MKRKTSKNTACPLASMVAGLVLTAALHAAPVLHEPFADADSSLDGNTTGTGLTGTWSSGGHTVVAQSLSFGSLAVSGNEVSGNVRTTSSASVDNLGDLLDDGSTLWFSVLWRTAGDIGTNPDKGFAIGTGPIGNGNNLSTSNSAVGFSIKSGQIQPSYWDPSNGTGVDRSGGVGASTTTTYLVVGELIWSNDGTSGDMINLYLPASGDLLPGAVAASIDTFDLDQTAFNTISIGNKADGLSTPFVYDQIRFGRTYADVVPDSADATDPTLASTDPVNLGTGGILLTATFDEPVAFGTGDIRIFNETDMVTPHTTISVTDFTQASISIDKLYIVPAAGLVPGETYYVEMDAGVVEDSNGNTFGGIAGDGTWKFTVESTAPTLADTDIVDQVLAGGSVVLEDTPFDYIVTFSEPMDPSTVNTSDFTNFDATSITVNSVTPGAPSFPLGDFTDTFTVSVTVNDPGTVTLQLPGTATLTDSVGNSMTALPVVDVETLTAIADPGTVTQDTTATTGGNSDTWMQPTNWDPEMIPSGSQAAVIAAGINARADNLDSPTDIPTYSGGLTLNANSSLMIGGSGSSEQRPDNRNALGTGTVTMNDGSTIFWRQKNDDPFPPIVYSGSATLDVNSNESANRTYEFDGGISGTGTFTINVPINNTYYRFTTANPGAMGTFIFTGNRTDNKGPRVEAEVAGCFGSLDITVGPTSGLQLETAGTIDDGATLTLLGEDSANTTGKIQFSSAFTETVGELWIDNTVGDGSSLVQLPAGDYTATTSPAAAGGGAILDLDGNPIISGGGTLTVLSGPGGGGDPFIAWSGLDGATGVTFDGDANGDGVQDGLAFLLGAANPNIDANAAGLLPTVNEDGSGNLVMQFNCLPTSARGTAQLRVSHSNDLASWTTTVDQVPDADDATADNDVTFVVTGPSGTPSVNSVTATINSGAAAGGKLFGRLKAEKP